ncbi:MAG: hypothetical protein KGM98_07720 [Bacteroidota bacterium]|nr:hypothetical protein [Bacteroidota bacterium]
MIKLILDLSNAARCLNVSFSINHLTFREVSALEIPRAGARNSKIKTLRTWNIATSLAVFISFIAYEYLAAIRKNTKNLLLSLTKAWMERV